MPPKTAYKTPEYYHCLDDARLRRTVYEPEADTFLFLDAIDADAQRLKASLGAAAAASSEEGRRFRCLEVGTGSGTVITHLFMRLATDGGHAGSSANTTATAAEFYAVDVNPVALEAAAGTWKATLALHGHIPHHTTTTDAASEKDSVPLAITSSSPPNTLTLIQGDLFTPFASTQHLQFDVVLFNPPYVPTSLEELQQAAAAAGTDESCAITAAWAGGPRGRVVLDRFLTQLPRHLRRGGGACYLVLIRENDVEDVKDFARAAFCAVDSSWTVDFTIVAQRYTGEHLCILRIDA